MNTYNAILCDLIRAKMHYCRLTICIVWTWRPAQRVNPTLDHPLFHFDIVQLHSTACAAVLFKCIALSLGSTIKLCNSTALVLQWFCFLLSFDIGLSEFAFLLHLNTFLLLLTWTFFISVGYLVHFCPQQMSVKETSTKLQFTRVDNLMINGTECSLKIPTQCAV